MTLDLTFLLDWKFLALKFEFSNNFIKFVNLIDFICLCNFSCTKSISQISIDNFLNEIILIDLHMISIDLLKHQLSVRLHLLQTQFVLNKQLTFLQGNLLPVRSRLVEAKMRRLCGIHDCVIAKHYHDKLIDALQTLNVGLINIKLVIDVSEKRRLFTICVFFER